MTGHNIFFCFYSYTTISAVLFFFLYSQRVKVDQRVYTGFKIKLIYSSKKVFFKGAKRNNNYLKKKKLNFALKNGNY